MNFCKTWKRSLDYTYSEMFISKVHLLKWKSLKSEYLEYFLNFISSKIKPFKQLLELLAANRRYKTKMVGIQLAICDWCRIMTESYVTKESNINLGLIAVVHFSCLFIDSSASSVWSAFDFATNFIHAIHFIKLALIAVNAFSG